MITIFLTFVSIINIVMTISVILGGIMAYRHGFKKAVDEIQERVINALKSEIEVLQRRITLLEKENTRLSAIIRLISAALKRRGLSVTIDGDLVSIEDEKTGKVTQISSLDEKETSPQ